ncbi:MAG: glycine betaine/L-proline ABC transporter ATP-binding protein [Deltaproteobacteria bacterium]|nr:glycine betaine/L-proline ABC transporter ATP-binding protein [Deltaproteobacteria bacterium]MBW2311025.1 glycine betaine/L-proline ABC transporter ATP-binding protein [Deltaproteobacteria bacterium]
MDQESATSIRCEDLWKVFGPNPERVIDEWDTFDPAITKTELLNKTGCVVGVRDASFTIAEGEVFVLMGLSGSGKSTLLRCINRLHEPTHGKVFIDDQDVTELSFNDLRDLRRRKTGMVFQHFALLPHRCVIENVAYGLEVQGISKAERESKAMESLELVGLKGWEKSYPHELSGGMQQRVGLARALATDPEILLMDEAFSALDPLIRRQMQDEFINLLQVVKKTTVFVTHDLYEALRLANRIAVMKFGAIQQIGTPSEIVLHPETDYVAEFVQDLPKVKFVTARDIMEEPEKWLVKREHSVTEIMNKMDSENIWYAFIVNEDQQVQGVVDYRMLSSTNGEKKLDAEKMITEYPTKMFNTFLESLVSVAAKSTIPIAVTDRQDRLAGVVSRERLLEALST